MSETKGGPVAARLIDVAIHSLRQDLLPLLRDDMPRVRVDHITRLLRFASAALGTREQALERLADAAREAGIEVPSLDGEPTPAKLERQRHGLETRIAEALPGLVDASARGDAEALRRLEAIVAMEKAFFASQDPDVLNGSQVAYRGGRIDSEPQVERTEPWPPLDDGSLTAYLRQRHGREDVRAEGVRAVPGGFSKETLFFALVDEAAGTRRDLVIRKDIPHPFVGNTVVDEFGPLQALHMKGFTVAKPVWLEIDPIHFGASFLVSERAAGTSNAATWAGDPVRAAKACRELARVVARLHQFTPAELGFPPQRASRSAGELIQAEIERWAALFRVRRQEPLPVQELPLVWLLRNIPQALYQRPARVVHGDVGFHNLMFDDNGDVTALLDWEFASLGDPTQDLCFVRLFVEPLMPWPEFLDLYRAFGGIEPCDEATFFFDLWTKTRNSIGCVCSATLFDTAMPRETKFAVAGHVFGPYLYIEECESVLDQLRQAGRP